MSDHRGSNTNVFRQGEGGTGAVSMRRETAPGEANTCRVPSYPVSGVPAGRGDELA